MLTIKRCEILATVLGWDDPNFYEPPPYPLRGVAVSLNAAPTADQSVSVPSFGWSHPDMGAEFQAEFEGLLSDAEDNLIGHDPVFGEGC